MSWGPATVYIHERVPDAEVRPGICDPFDRSLSQPLTQSGPVLSIPRSVEDALDAADASSIDSNGLSTRVLPPLHTDDSSR